MTVDDRVRAFTVAAYGFDHEARQARDAGGAWSNIIALEHQRSADQLRVLRGLVRANPDEQLVAIADAYLTAATSTLATIRRSNAA